MTPGQAQVAFRRTLRASGLRPDLTPAFGRCPAGLPSVHSSAMLVIASAMERLVPRLIHALRSTRMSSSFHPPLAHHRRPSCFDLIKSAASQPIKSKPFGPNSSTATFNRSSFASAMLGLHSSGSRLASAQSSLAQRSYLAHSAKNHSARKLASFSFLASYRSIFAHLTALILPISILNALFSASFLGREPRH